MKIRYKHAYTFAFSLENSSPDGIDTTADELRAAIIQRVMHLSDEDILGNAGMPYDTYEIVDELP